MDATDYMVAWGVYLVAGAVVAVLSWRVLPKYLPRALAYLLECILLALMFTPAYVLSDQSIMAPALMVALMDAITIEHKAGIRALIPLVLALLLAVLVAGLLSLIERVRRRRAVNSQDSEP